MIEVLKQMVDVLEYWDVHGKIHQPTEEAIQAGKQAIAKLESQEPVAWLLTDKNINSLQVDSIQRLIDRLKHAHHTDLCVRINGQDEWFQADWLKHMVRVTLPQRTEQEPEAWMYQEYRDDDQFGWRDEIQFVQPPNDPNYFRNIVPVYTTPPQRTWVGLTDEEVESYWDWEDFQTGAGRLTILEMVRDIEAKLKDKNT